MKVKRQIPRRNAIKRRQCSNCVEDVCEGGAKYDLLRKGGAYWIGLERCGALWGLEIARRGVRVIGGGTVCALLLGFSVGCGGVRYCCGISMGCLTWGVGSAAMVPLSIGTYSEGTGVSVLTKIWGGVESEELSTGVGGGTKGSGLISCNSMFSYVAILQPKKNQGWSDSKRNLHAVYAWGKISPIIPMCN